MYSANIIAKYVIMRFTKLNSSISNLKLQKLLYFIQAEFLVSKNKPCFSDSIEAWDIGPVIPNVYRKYKIYGGGHIPWVDESEEFYFSNDDQKLIDGIVEQCLNYSSAFLTKITQNQEPWKNVYNRYVHKIISNESIKNYFEKNK